jgi:hypothetical protein
MSFLNNMYITFFNNYMQVSHFRSDFDTSYMCVKVLSKQCGISTNKRINQIQPIKKNYNEITPIF